jgi:hypothetical protein
MGRLTPGGAEPRTGRLKVARHVLLTCCLLAATPAGLFAQGADPEQVHYVKVRTFNIPFSIDNDPRIVDVLLHVSSDQGRTYRYVTAGRPADRRFFFQAPGDGTFFFVVQTRDQSGVLTPSDFRGVAPSLRVCVDTQKPVIKLNAVPPQDGYSAAIQWTIEDENFDDLRADYRSVNGGDWYPLLLQRTASGRHDWTPAVPGPIEVRMQAIDKAKNQADPKSATVTPDPRRASMTPTGGGDPGDIKHVNTRKFQLNYELDDSTVGPSRVKSVDIWKIRQGGPWQKIREPGPASGPVLVEVDTPGRWGFRLIPRSGVGLAEPDPRPGDPPDIWVEVDERPPQVRVTNVVVGQGADAGNVTIYWSASDTFLTARPITIYYAVDPQKEWKPITEDPLPNNPCSYTFKPPPDLYQFHIKVQAVDEAGNKGEDKWRDAVMVDLKIPRIKKHIEVRPGEGQQQTQGAPPPRPSITVKPAGGSPETPPPNPNGLPGWNNR